MAGMTDPVTINLAICNYAISFILNTFVNDNTDMKIYSVGEIVISLPIFFPTFYNTTLYITTLIYIILRIIYLIK